MMGLLPVSLSIGLLCGLWFQATIWQPWLIAWVGYAAWASFYFAGGDKPALMKSLTANFAGMIQGALFFYLWSKFGGGSMVLLSIVIGILCFVMTMEGSIPWLALIPGQFVGCAVYFGNLGGHGGDIWVTLLNTAGCMLIGNVAGLLSAELPNLFKHESREQVTD